MIYLNRYTTAACLAIMVYSILLLEVNLAVFLTKEDGVIETIGAASFLIAGLIFLKLYVTSASGNDFIILHTKKNVFFLLLAVAFIFAAGEEISWGQRFFNFGTPESLKIYNEQNEFNIHNIWIFHGLDKDGNVKSGLAAYLTFSRIFALFWFLYCIIVPLLFKYSLLMKNIVKRVNLPVVSLRIGVFFLISYLLLKLLQKTLAYQGLTPVLEWPLIETREAIEAILFAIIAWNFLDRSKSSAAPES